MNKEILLLAMAPEVRFEIGLIVAALAVAVAALAIFLLYKVITLPIDEPDEPPQWWCPTCQEETDAAYYPPAGEARMRCQSCRSVLDVNQRWLARAANE